MIILRLKNKFKSWFVFHATHQIMLWKEFHKTFYDPCLYLLMSNIWKEFFVVHVPSRNIKELWLNLIPQGIDKLPAWAFRECVTTIRRGWWWSQSILIYILLWYVLFIVLLYNLSSALLKFVVPNVQKDLLLKSIWCSINFTFNDKF